MHVLVVGPPVMPLERRGASLREVLHAAASTPGETVSRPSAPDGAPNM
jgi:hypothetical protein